MAINPLLPIRRRQVTGSVGSAELLTALSDAAQSHAEGEVLAAHIGRRYAIPCVVLARAPKGWTVAGTAGLPSGMRLHLGTHVASTVEPGRWLYEASGASWVRRDLSHGRRVVARVMLRAERVTDEIHKLCVLAAPALAAAYPRQPGASPLELYLAQIVHDLRQPLSTLQLAHGLLREAAGGESKVLDRCQRALSDLSDLMDDLLAFAAPGHGPKKRGHLPIRLRDLVAQVVGDHEPHARFRQATLEIEVRADPTVLGSPLGLRRALANVIDNALIHSPAGGRVAVVLDVDYQSTLIEVRDEGPGVPRGLREQVFEPFFTTRANGNGLGLAVVRLVAQCHGGVARFVDCDHGATLQLAIPHQPAANLIPL